MSEKKMGRPKGDRVRHTFFVMPAVVPFLIKNKAFVERLAELWAADDVTIKVIQRLIER